MRRDLTAGVLSRQRFDVSLGRIAEKVAERFGVLGVKAKVVSEQHRLLDVGGVGILVRQVMAPGNEQAGIPISILARVVALHGDVRQLGLSAVGFHRFIGRDVEYRYSNIIAWLLEKGLVFKDGDTCGLSAEEMIRIRYKDKGRVSPNPILEFDVERLDDVHKSSSDL